MAVGLSEVRIDWNWFEWLSLVFELVILGCRSRISVNFFLSSRFAKAASKVGQFRC